MSRTEIDYNLLDDESWFITVESLESAIKTVGELVEDATEDKLEIMKKYPILVIGLVALARIDALAHEVRIRVIDIEGSPKPNHENHSGA